MKSEPVFKNAIVRPPTPNFADGLTTAGLGAPDFARALEQHGRYAGALAHHGVAVVTAAPDAAFPDATFVEDVAVMTPGGAVLMRPGAKSRAGEVASLRSTIASCVPIAGAIEAPGSVDGGDVCAAGETFFIGLSSRTDEEGARQLGEILARQGFAVRIADVRRADGLLHLKSGMAWLGGRRLLAVDALARDPAFEGYERVTVPDDETYAANAVAIGGRVLLAGGFLKTRRAVEAAGLEVVALDMSEFQKMDGGLSCLSLRF
ncbi:MAG TPA: hypothetical protein VFV19_11900 [Candidatus Polarisedimenticolaceae bacterium]|nr:hypothetical protein [Candidatus Polarisedimenticolaceae bacterium]